jgi:CRISPR-associated endonuclease/helicase Cas3
VTDNSEIYFHYWGKAARLADRTNQRSYHLLAYHCLDVAAVGQQLLLHDSNLLRKIIPSDVFNDDPEREQWCVGVVTFLLALHDIGKFSDRFQNLIPELLKELKGYSSDRTYTVHHTDMGRLLFEKEIWQKIWDSDWFHLDPNDDRSDWKDVWNPWFFAVTGHHGIPPEKPEPPISMLFEDENRQSAILFSEECAMLFLKTKFPDHRVFSEKYLSEFSRASWLLAGLAVLSDWIGSNNDHFSYHSTAMPLEKYWKEYAIPQAENAIRAFGILPGTVSSETGMHALFPDLQTPTPLQSFAETCEIPPTPQLFIIEEATGSGKTETALVLAHRLMAQGLAEGIYFGLPTMATANAMYDRMGKAYGHLFSRDSHPSLVLAHSGSKLSEKFRQSIGYSDRMVSEQEHPGEMSASTQCTAWLADNRKKALLAQVGVGTIDQALIAVLPLHHQSLRLLGLSRNILIVDEVHAFDTYVERVLEKLLEFHAAMGGSAILLSATLPQAQRQELISAYSSGLGIHCSEVRQSHYPMVTHVTPQTKEPAEYPIQRCEMTHRTIEVECTDDSSAVMKHLSKAIEDGGCACWVKNTVDDAIETYQTLSKLFGNKNVLLFHARFTMGDRIKKENEVLKLFGKDSTPEIRKGRILVATQVVEQSLDLDFDFMVTDLAPMDLIIQRSGRLHRHNDLAKRGNRGVPRLVVMSPPVSEKPMYEWYSTLFPKGAYVYPNHGQLWLTARLLAERKKITMPDDARLLIEGTFGESAQRKIPELLIYHEIKADGKNMADQATAQLNVLHLSNGYKDTPNQWQDDSRTPTRLGEARVTVLLLKWENSVLNFFSSELNFSEELSQVSISETKISKEFTYTGDLAAALEKFKVTLADKGRWRILVPLERKNDTCQGKALDKNGKVVSVLYDSKLGVQIIRP